MRPCWQRMHVSLCGAQVFNLALAFRKKATSYSRYKYPEHHTMKMALYKKGQANSCMFTYCR